jgi:uncharacterized protein YqeY
MLQIEKMIMSAMKAHETEKAQTYKLIKAKILEFKKQPNAPEYTEEAEISVLKKMVKELEKEKEIYSKVDTDIAKERLNETVTQLNIVNELLPSKASDEDIIEGINDWVVKYGKIEPKQISMVINHVKVKYINAEKSDIARLIKKAM